MAEGTPFEKLALDAVKAIGKALGQMSLYRIGHPAVSATLHEALRCLGEALARSATGEVALTIDHDRLIANGQIVGTLAVVPNAVTALFGRFKLNSVIFKAGLSEKDLTALCELAALKPEAGKTADAAAFLAGRGAACITLNEALYAKVEKATAGPVPVETAAAAPAVRAEALAEMPVEDAIKTLVDAALSDPAERARVYEAVIRQIQAELELKVAEATKVLRREKTGLQNEQARVQAVVGQMADGVVVVDDAGKVLMMNPAAEALYGVKLAAVAGRPLADIAREEHLMSLASEISTPQDREIKGDVAIRANERTGRALRSSSALVTNEAGKPVGLVSALPDVTKQRELDRREREFVAHVTHELRGPLSSIRAALEILQGQVSSRLDEDEAKIFGTAVRNTDRLERLINTILDFAKIESGQMTVRPEPADPAALAQDALDSMKAWAQKKGLVLSAEIAPGLPQVLADSLRVVQILNNLLSNAIKFTPGGGRILLRAVLGEGKRSGFVVFSVTDSGVGIAPKDHERVFEKFVQISSGQKHVGGTGLGLAIAKALARLHKGDMWIESEEGRGATFLFNLPVHVASQESAAQPVPEIRPWWRRLLGI